MVNKSRIGIYLDDEEMARQVKVAAAKRRISVSRYCGRAIEERLIKDGERKNSSAGAEALRREKMAFLARVERLRKKIGPTGAPPAELVREGRRE